MSSLARWRRCVTNENGPESRSTRLRHSLWNLNSPSPLFRNPKSSPDMRYVILRDDDTNALTPTECLEQLYRPFLDRGLPVNLATIPRVRTDTLTKRGAVEGYLLAKTQNTPATVPFSDNAELVRYLHENTGY